MPTTPENNRRTVIIIYTADSAPHTTQVRNLARMLRDAGLAVTTSSKPTQHLVANPVALTQGPITIVVCTSALKRCIESQTNLHGHAGKARQDGRNRDALSQPIPLLLGAEPKSSIPTMLRQRRFFRLRHIAPSESGFEILLNALSITDEQRRPRKSSSGTLRAKPKQRMTAGRVPFISTQPLVDAGRKELPEDTYFSHATGTLDAADCTPALYPVWYATNRNLKNPTDATKGFGPGQSNGVHHGVCSVSIPKSHKIGSIGSSFFRRLLQGTDDRLKVVKRVAMPTDQFWMDISQRLKSETEGKRVALAFIHGFNVSFDGAAIRAAQLGFDLGVPLTAFYSWPSHGSLGLRRYGADREAIDASVGHITEFLVRLATESRADAIHVIAHSMGNVGLLRAMEKMTSAARARSGKLFGQIILAAPDVDQTVFCDVIAAHAHLADQTTLYASKGDMALKASAWLRQGRPRAGYIPPVTVVNGVTTVDVSPVDLSRLGHGYFSEMRAVLTDMFQAIHNNSTPDRRHALKPIRHIDGGTYWRIQP